MKMTRFFVAAMCAAAALAQEVVDAVDTADSVDAAKAKPAAKAPAANPFGFERGAFDTEQPMTITSDRFEFDYKQMVAIFDEQVKVTHPQFYLEADQVFVFIDDTNEAKKNDLKNILAQGNVVMTNDKNRASCDWVLYTRAEGTLVMRANEGGYAQLMRGADSQEAKEFTLWLDDGRMQAVGGTKTTISPETLKPGGAKKETPEVKKPEEEILVDPEKPAVVKPSLYKDPEAKVE